MKGGRIDTRVALLSLVFEFIGNNRCPRHRAHKPSSDAATSAQTHTGAIRTRTAPFHAAGPASHAVFVTWADIQE